MGRSLLVGGAMCAVLLVAATTRSDVVSKAPVADGRSPLPEPITEDAVDPAPDDATAPDPFEPLDVGPPESVWPYESLSSEEQALIDHGRQRAWTHDAYAGAVKERSRMGRARAAQHLLGLDSLDAIGVVP